MAEEKKKNETRWSRIIAQGIFGGLSAGMLMYLAVLFFKVAINTIAGTTLIPNGTEVGGFALGFSGGISYAIPRE